MGLLDGFDPSAFSAQQTMPGILNMPRLPAPMAPATPPQQQFNNHSTSNHWLALLMGGPMGLMREMAQQKAIDAQAQGRRMAYGPMAQMFNGQSSVRPDDPRFQAAQAQALTNPYGRPEDVAAYGAIAKAGEPDIQNTNGWTYDAHDTANANKFWGKPPVDGALPLVDPQNPGAVRGWYLPDGTVQAIGATEGAKANATQAAAAKYAEPIAQGTASGTLQGQIPLIGQKAFNESRGTAAGQAPYEFVNVPTVNGAPRTVSKSVAAGGDFTGQGTGDAAYGGDIAKAAAGRYTAMQAAIPNAQEKINGYRQIASLLQGVDGGKLTPTGVEIASAANSLHIHLDKNLGNEQAAQAIANKLAMELRNPAGGAGMPGSMSNSDRDFLVKTTPGLVQSAAGRQQIVNFGIATAQRQIQVAQMARQWQRMAGRIDAADKNGKTFDDYLQDWVNAHPLFGAR